jgi:hypothetical protein
MSVRRSVWPDRIRTTCSNGVYPSRSTRTVYRPGRSSIAGLGVFPMGSPSIERRPQGRDAMVTGSVALPPGRRHPVRAPRRPQPRANRRRPHSHGPAREAGRAHPTVAPGHPMEPPLLRSPGLHRSCAARPRVATTPRHRAQAPGRPRLRRRRAEVRRAGVLRPRPARGYWQSASPRSGMGVAPPREPSSPPNVAGRRSGPP